MLLCGEAGLDFLHPLSAEEGNVEFPWGVEGIEPFPVHCHLVCNGGCVTDVFPLGSLVFEAAVKVDYLLDTSFGPPFFLHGFDEDLTHKGDLVPGEQSVWNGFARCFY